MSTTGGPIYFTIDNSDPPQCILFHPTFRYIAILHLTILLLIPVDWLHGHFYSVAHYNARQPHVAAFPAWPTVLAGSSSLLKASAKQGRLIWKSPRRPNAPTQQSELSVDKFNSSLRTVPLSPLPLLLPHEGCATVPAEFGSSSNGTLCSDLLPSVLADNERRLFNLLLEVNKRFRLKAQVRVGGGWVRDKLLGRVPNDMDLVVIGPMPTLQLRFNPVPTLTGPDFFYFIQRFLWANGYREFKGFAYFPAGGGRRLEVAVGKVFGIELAIASLWIPQKHTVGNLYEDARRRDLTINSLFYNIHTGLVEDWLGQGLQDLLERRIRTPMHPLDTFDAFPMAPARPLRCIRFACRLNFTLDPVILKAAGMEKVRHDLATRVSRNRLGTEIEELMACPDPHRAVALLAELHFRDIVFQIHPPANSTATNARLLQPIPWASDPTSPSSWEAALTLLGRCVHHPFYAALPDPTARAALSFAALFYGIFSQEPLNTPMALQYTATKAWFHRVSSYPFRIHQRVACMAARVTVGALAVPSLVGVVQLDPAADPETFLALFPKLRVWQSLLRNTYTQPALHFYDCIRREDQPPSAPIRSYLERVAAIESLYALSELRRFLHHRKLDPTLGTTAMLWCIRQEVVHYHMAYPQWSREKVVESALQSLQRKDSDELTANPD
eukprot:GGOE01037393.1.p1 GENE.GGOE01037393.1~~GGOE01037393.1.p1  ORF type:complete len:682 (+),score=154.53 GGOE01037393.1:42-2048(+)